MLKYTNLYLIVSTIVSETILTLSEITVIDETGWKIEFLEKSIVSETYRFWKLQPGDTKCIIPAGTFQKYTRVGILTAENYSSIHQLELFRSTSTVGKFSWKL